MEVEYQDTTRMHHTINMKIEQVELTLYGGRSDWVSLFEQVDNCSIKKMTNFRKIIRKIGRNFQILNLIASMLNINKI